MSNQRRPRPPPHDQFYDSNGAPIGGGCRKGSDCNFVHPSHPQWTAARISKPWAPAYQSHRDRERDRGEEWGRGGDSGRSWNSRREAPQVTSSNAIPTGPRRMMEAAASSSGWGSKAIAGSPWEESDASSSNNPWARTGAQTQPSSSSSAMDWTPSQNSGWGNAAEEFTWGDPASVSEAGAGGWGEAPSRSGAGEGWGDSPQKSPEHSKDATRSSFPAPEDKGKGREVVESPVAESPQASFYTPQIDFPTSRTPRSPIRCPQDPRTTQDPRRKSLVAGASLEDQATAMNAARDMQKAREGMRMSSMGVPIPTSNAGPESASSSKTNPFAFPAYTPAENMDVSHHEPELDQLHEHQPPQAEVMEQDRDISPEPLPRDQPLPVGLKAMWKDFTRTLSKAVSLQLELKTLEESREKQRRLHRSKAYQSASMVNVHSKLEKLHQKTDDAISEIQRQLNRCLDHLVRYPLQGLPVPAEGDTHESELELVRSYAAKIQSWLDQIKPMVEQHQAAYQLAEERRLQAEEEARKAAEEEEARAKAQLNKAKWTPIASERKLLSEMKDKAGDMDVRATDLEYEIDEIRTSGPTVTEVLLRELEERGFQRLVPPRVSETPSEEGEVLPERPALPRSYEELKEDVADLRKRFKKAKKDINMGTEALENYKQRGMTQKLDYYELASENTRLNMKVQELENSRKELTARCASTDQALADLRAIIDQHGASLPPPQPQPPTAEEITEHLKAALVADLMSVVERALGRLKCGVEESMKSNEEIICRQLFTILQPAVAMVSTVKPVLDSYPDPQTLLQEQMAMMPPPPPPPVQRVQHS